MATTAQNFFPKTTEQDYTAPGELDIRKLEEAVGVSDNTTTADFGTAAAEIILDPFTARTTTGTTNADDFGWSVNRSGTDGMDSTSTEKRRILAGTWTFLGRFGSSGVLLGSYRLRARVYRVTSDGNRTLLFGPVNSATVTPSVLGNDVSITAAGQAEIILEADETVHVSFAIEKTAATALDEGAVQFRLNDSSGNDATVTIPSPGVRTLYIRSHSTSISLIATVARLVSAFRSGTASLSLAGTATRLISAFRSFSTALSLTGLASRLLTAARNFSSNLSLNTSIVKLVILTAFSTALSLSASVIKLVIPGAKTAVLSLSASFTRQILAFKSFTTELGLGTVFARSFIGVRQFITALTLAADGFVRISFSILNRIVSGGTTVIKKIINLFED